MFQKIVYLLSRIQKRLSLPSIKNSRVEKTAKIEAGTIFVNSTIRRHSFCGFDCEVYHADIGSFCSIANGVVLGGGEHPSSWVGTSPVFYSGRDSVSKKFSEFERPLPAKTIVGNDVWIGRSAFVKSGIRIGDGAIIGAGAVVTRNVPDYAIVGGNPAALIRYRFDDESIKQLLSVQWWNWSDDDIKASAVHIKDVSKFLQSEVAINKMKV